MSTQPLPSSDSCACSGPRQLAEPDRDRLFNRQRKVLAPNEFSDLDALAEPLLEFQYHWECAARPFEWKFTRQSFGQTPRQVANERWPVCCMMAHCVAPLRCA